MRPGYGPGPYVTPADLLRQADSVLRSAAPTWTASFHADGFAYRARFAYPGILSVFTRNTGELVARSRPGQPTKLAVQRKARHANPR